MLVGGVALFVIGGAFIPTRVFRGTLADLVPTPLNVPGWTIERLHVADTVEMSKVVQEFLAYDDAAHVVFKRGNLRVSIYLAYWAPGKVSYRWVAGHTPDICWLAHGWECMLRGTAMFKNPASEALSVPMEHRVFLLAGHTEHVVFVHLAGRRAVTYSGEGWIPRRSDFLLDLFNTDSWERPDKEQFFLRISSNRTLEEFREAPPVVSLLDALVSTYLRPVGFRTEKGVKP